MEEANPKYIAQLLLNIGAVTLSPEEPFTWTSGIKSPIYTDNRLIMSYPNERTLIESAFCKLIEDKFPEAEVIAGTATAGIPHAAIIADRMNLPMVYVRSSSKGHGKKNAIEGHLIPGQKVVMIEDLISTGGSVINAAELVSEAGGKVIGAAAVFNYLLPQGIKAFTEVSYPLYTLTDYKQLVQLVTDEGEYAEHKTLLEEWYQDPVSWTEQFKA